MTYTGMVSPGGPAAVRELDGLTIRKASVSDMDNNVYLLTCTRSGAQALVDAADDAARLLALVQEGGGGLDLVVTTHQHWDHHRALAEVLAATSAAAPGPRASTCAAPRRAPVPASPATPSALLHLPTGGPRRNRRGRAASALSASRQPCGSDRRVHAGSPGHGAGAP